MGGVRVPLFAFIVYVIIYPDVSSHGTNVCFFPFTGKFMGKFASVL